LSLSSNDFASAIAAIESAETVALACHVNPDGDALGSMLALGLALIAKYPNKSITILSHDGVPEIYSFLPGSDLILTESVAGSYDLAIALDSGDVKRIGESICKTFADSKARLDIDHHVGDGAVGDVRLIDSRAAATAEIVYDLLVYLDSPISVEIATCLLTGVITDTGSFRFMNVTPRTLRTAASLIEAGATPSLIAERVFDNRTYAATHLLGLCLSSLRISADGYITYASVKRADFVETRATDQDTEGFINLIRSIRGSEVALLFREFDLGTVRVSLRSSDKVNVAEVAQQFNGGGHKMASGCTFYGTLEDAEAALLTAASNAIHQ
jgi:bifunctional oligoribonuclease and PAP phosphatase NrnA